MMLEARLQLICLPVVAHLVLLVSPFFSGMGLEDLAAFLSAHKDVGTAFLHSDDSVSIDDFRSAIIRGLAAPETFCIVNFNRDSLHVRVPGWCQAFGPLVGAKRLFVCVHLECAPAGRNQHRLLPEGDRACSTWAPLHASNIKALPSKNAQW